ncbi:tetraspanintetraspanin-8 [Podarcis lilfordi]|uniref:Tetraspanin n=1 Tax=Podarcis lilfordi TaxID=74358 RepID=A0AA35PE56_9SAUR|nr:tetraspanintetraspanin-8 [Podarcis lilfordi]
MAGVSSCMKYSMFIFNFLFWMCGCAILAASIYMRVNKDAQESFNKGSGMFAGIDLLIAVGAIIMVMGFLGCCGAMKESQCMLLLFFIGLLIILLLQIVAGILGGVYKSKVEEVVNKTLTEEVQMLQDTTGNNQDFQAGFHKFEQANKCCGLLKGESDWGKAQSTYNGCQCDSKDAGTSVCKGDKYTTPCREVIMEFFKNNMVIVMGIAFGLAFIEVLGLVFSMSLYCQIQRK